MFKDWFNQHKDDPCISRLIAAVGKRATVEALTIAWAAGHTTGWNHAYEDYNGEEVAE